MGQLRSLASLQLLWRCHLLSKVNLQERVFLNLSKSSSRLLQKLGERSQPPLTHLQPVKRFHRETGTCRSILT